MLFTGHARSGHSIVGAMLDAHPEMVVAHEFNIPKHWDEIIEVAKNKRLLLRDVLFQYLLKSSSQTVVAGNRGAERARDEGHYQYHIPGQWQGTFRKRMKASMAAKLQLS